MREIKEEKESYFQAKRDIINQVNPDLEDHLNQIENGKHPHLNHHLPHERK